MCESSGEVAVEVDEVVECPRCLGAAYLSAQVPRRLALSRDSSATGYRTIVLCPACDRKNPHATGLLAFFAVHERIDTATVREAAPLIDEWVRRSTADTYTDADLDEDIRLWESGEM